MLCFERYYFLQCLSLDNVFFFKILIWIFLYLFFNFLSIEIQSVALLLIFKMWVFGVFFKHPSCYAPLNFLQLFFTSKQSFITKLFIWEESETVSLYCWITSLFFSRSHYTLTSYCSSLDDLLPESILVTLNLKATRVQVLGCLESRDWQYLAQANIQDNFKKALTNTNHPHRGNFHLWIFACFLVQPRLQPSLLQCWKPSPT